MTKPVLITGGAGSVGRQLAGMLLDQGKSVRVFDLPFMDFAGLEGEENVEVVKGDITDATIVSQAVVGVRSVLHLAAILPPNSEKDRNFTFKVNVDGTKNIVDAMRAGAPDATIVFTSSISTYGDTSSEEPPVTIQHSQDAIDVYADSKISGEKVVKESGVNSVILRIASIAVPEFLEPPDPWPFTAEQRVEMIHRDDVADALRNAIDSREAIGKIFNIAGGESWRLKGKNYVEDFYEVMGAPIEMAKYRYSAGWNDWYDTDESQKVLKYQNRSYQQYADQMRSINKEMMEE